MRKLLLIAILLGPISQAQNKIPQQEVYSFKFTKLQWIGLKILNEPINHNQWIKETYLSEVYGLNMYSEKLTYYFQTKGLMLHVKYIGGERFFLITKLR